MKIETKETDKSTINVHIDFEECQSIEKIVGHLYVISKTAIDEVCEAAADEEMNKETLLYNTYRWLAEIFTAYAKGEIDE